MLKVCKDIPINQSPKCRFVVNNFVNNSCVKLLSSVFQ